MQCAQNWHGCNTADGLDAAGEPEDSCASLDGAGVLCSCCVDARIKSGRDDSY